MNKTTEITILGQKLVVKSESDQDYVVEVAHFVDNKIKEIIQNTKSVASLNVAILAAMNIADEYFRLKRDRDKKFEIVEKKVQDLIELIDIQL